MGWGPLILYSDPAPTTAEGLKEWFPLANVEMRAGSVMRGGSGFGACIVDADCGVCLDCSHCGDILCAGCGSGFSLVIDKDKLTAYCGTDTCTDSRNHDLASMGYRKGAGMLGGLLELFRRAIGQQQGV